MVSYRAKMKVFAWRLLVQAFPFSSDEWDALTEVSRGIVNATFAGDEALHASLEVEMQSVLDDLQHVYGEHPVLIETRADYCDDPVERQRLYDQAARLADEHRLPTLSIRLSLAELLLDEDEFRLAHTELMSCEAEVRDANHWDQKNWKSLLERAQQGIGSQAN